jgi:3-hydroxybutyryl-CoA dehydrogenase
MRTLVTAESVRRAAVLGAGTMGQGIAQVAATAGLEVALFDVQQEFVDGGLARIRRSLEEGVAKGRVAPTDRDAALARVSGTTRFEDAVRGVELLIEAIPEDLELKREAFERVDRLADEGALLATNTSSLSIGAIAEATRRPERVVGMHFFNPPPVMKLVEVIRGARTSPEAVETARALALRFGKEPIVVKDSPGFASSRLGICLGLEAIRMLEQGVATAEDIDKAMELGYRHPMGPLKLTDLVGLDVRLMIAEHLHRELGEAFRPPELLRRLVAEGKLGKKSGEGFYKY